MSEDKLPQKNNNEEVDLGVLFNAIGRFFDKVFSFFTSLFKAVFMLIVLPLKLMVNYYIPVISVLVLSIIAGFVIDNYKENVYKSHIIVKPFFDSKYEIVNNINYYNSLISDENYQSLVEIFDIDEEYAKNLVRFEIGNGPETDNDIRLDYEEYIKEIDSIRALEIPFEKYKIERDIYSFNSYKIIAYSLQKEGFKTLEKGLVKSFLSPYAIKQKEKNDSLLLIDKNRVLSTLKQIESIQEIYKEVISEQSSAENIAGFNVKDGLIVQEKSTTHEIELVKQEVNLRRQLSKINSEIIESKNFFEILLNFQNVGSTHKPVTTKFKLIFPLIIIVGFFIIYYLGRTISYIKKY